MNQIKKAIPNTITCLNLFSGCIACTFAFFGQFKWAFVFIILSAIFDFLDGMVARLLKVSSPIGKELDSLADDISFGLVPAILVFSLMINPLNTFVTWPNFLHPISFIIPFLAFLIAIFSALRLAKFNIDPRQSHSFIGLPTPANTLFWISFVWGGHELFQSLNVFILIGMIIVSSGLLVAEIPMFSLKFANLSWKENKIRYIFLITSIPLLFLGKISLAAIILWYIILSLATSRVKSEK